MSGLEGTVIELSLRRTWRNAGAPSDGGAGTLANIAEAGDLLIDFTNTTLYQNTNTQSSPTWTLLGAGSSPGLVGDMAANGTGTANVIGVDAGFSPADHVHKIGEHAHSAAPKGSPIVLAALGAGIFTADATGRGKFATDFVDATILGDGAVDDADKFGAGALSADATGRAVMASDFFNAATAADKFEDSSIPGAKVNFSFGVTPVTIVPDATGAEGSSASVARADHTHGLTAATPDATYSLAAAAAEGSASTFLRSDAVFLARLANDVDFVGRNAVDGADVNAWKLSAQDLFHISTVSYEVGTANLTTFTVSNPGAPRTITFADPGGADSVAYLDTTQILTNKSLTAPTITGGTAIELTALSVRSTAGNDLLFASTEALGADRTLEFDVSDANKKITLTGDFTMSGAFGLTLTITNTTDVTLPITGTLATLAGSEALTNKTITAMAGNMNMTDQTLEGSTAADGDLTLAATTSGTTDAAYIVAEHALDSSIGGLATSVVAGAVGDGSFVVTAPPNGMMAIDSANGRLYFKYGAAWHYTAQTAGIQIPVEEIGDMKVGDEIYCEIDKVMSDGAMHALWRVR